MSGKFKYTEDEFERIAFQMYRLMTARASAILEHWAAFKSAQSTVNPAHKYSINYPNPRVMKELRRRVDRIFAEMAKKKNEPVVINDEALDMANKIFAKLGIFKGTPTHDALLTSKVTETGRAILSSMKVPAVGTDMDSLNQNRQVKLLTGNTVERELENRMITIVTNCPKKFVIVDLETGEQWSSNGIKSGSHVQTAKVKATRKVSIPRPKKG